MKLTGKVALITGGTRIGSAVARALARRGCRTAMTYLSSSAAAEDTARRIRRLGRKTLTLRADLSAPGEADRVVETVSRAWGGVDILYRASRYMSEALGDARFKPARLVEQKMAYNELGPKTGRGFFDYSGERRQTFEVEKVRALLRQLKRAREETRP